MYMERVYHGAKALGRACALAKRMGVWTDEQHAEMVAAIREGEPAAGPDFSSAVGGEFVIDLKTDTNKENGKTSIKMQYVGIWSADDERVANFVAKERGEGEGVKATPAKPAAAKPAAAATNGKAKVEPAKVAAKTTTTTTAKSAVKKTAAQVDDL
jgi:hypothetical protein